MGVERPQRANREHGRGLPGEVGRRHRGRVSRFVVEENPALPIVQLDAKDAVGKEQDRNARLWFGHGEQSTSAGKTFL